MSRRPPFDLDVSVTADKRRRMRRRGMSGAFETGGRSCEWPGCEAKGTYRAPRSRDNLDDYRWFCLDHVRAYNASWNYFADMPDGEVENLRRRDSVWDRPTWRFGEQPRNPLGANPHAEGQAWRRFGFTDPIEVLGDNATLNPGRGGDERARRPRKLPKNERRAIEILQVADTAGKPEIRAAYKALVKALHPDLNGGDRSEETRLVEVLWAWEQIKGSSAFRD